MKKLKYILIFVFILALFMSLYGYTSAFQLRNVEAMSIGGETVEVSQEEAEYFIKQLQTLKQYPAVSEHESGSLKLIVMEMKYGSDKSFELALDYNFDQVTIKDLDSKAVYLIEDEFATWLYKLDVNAEMFAYRNPILHEVEVQGQAIDNYYLDYHFKLADNNWYDLIQSSGEVQQFVINEPEILLSATSEGDQLLLRVRKDELVVYEGSLEDFVMFDISGSYDFEVITKWKDETDELYFGEQTTTFDVEAIYPPEFTVTDTQVTQGEFIVIGIEHVYDPETLFIEQSFIEGLGFVKNGNSYECFVPTGYYTEPGLYSLKYGVDGYEFELNFEVAERDFKYQNLTVKTSTVKATRNDEAYAQYNEYVKPALKMNVFESKEAHLMNQSFVLPVKGRVTTEFGVRRIVNKTLTSYRHSGIDIAAPTGTDVVATYEGQVVLSMELILTGNTVIISHGNGIFSMYLHLDELSVEEDEIVETGQLIGKVGSTGFSTGAHLHFTVCYYNMNIEPGYFIYGEPVTYENYRALFEME